MNDHEQSAFNNDVIVPQVKDWDKQKQEYWGSEKEEENEKLEWSEASVDRS